MAAEPRMAVGSRDGPGAHTQARTKERAGIDASAAESAG